jgi:uncharacterized sodium:solute symporter family permease YidK
LLLCFDKGAHLLSSILFAFAAILIAGVNLYALAIVVEALLGWPQWVAIVVAGFFVLAYITLGGLSSAIYNEVLQFFVILAALLPITVLGLKKVGGWGGLTDKLTATHGHNFTTAWGGTGIGHVNPLGANWLTIVLGLGFVLSFGYWTTNFAEVQRALSAKNLSAAQRTPLIAAYPKIFIVFLVMIPGLVAAALVPKIGTSGSGLQYNDAIPYLMQELLPNGVLGIAVTGLLAAFMAGMAANVSSFNTVFTNDIWAKYVVKHREDAYYVRFGRLITAIGVLASVGTAFLASSFSNIMSYLQTLFSFFNVPIFNLQRADVRGLRRRHVLEARVREVRLLGAARGHSDRDGELLRHLQARHHRHPLRAGRQLRLRDRRLRGRCRRHGGGVAVHQAEASGVPPGPGVRHPLARHGRAARDGRRRLVPQAGPAGLGRGRPRPRLLHPVLALTAGGLRDHVRVLRA